MATRSTKTKTVDGKELSRSDFAWAPGDDPADWKLPIHDKDHAQNAMARFNQTEGIPDAEKKAVAKKIAAKAKSFGIDTTDFEKEYARSLRIAELRIGLPKLEVRMMARIELRRTDAGPKIGMTIPYNSESEDLGGFRECVRAGCFSKTMQEQDVRALWNHDPNWVLGRTGNKTLALRSTDGGLDGEVTLDPEDQMHTHFARRVERGDVAGASFGFEKVRDNWDGTASDGMPLRSLIEARLFDLSPVTFAAYPAAAAEQRSLLDVASVRAGVDLAVLAAALAAAEDGRIAVDAAAAVRSYVDRIVAMLPAPPAPQRSDEDRRRLLRQAERIAQGAAAA